MEHKLSMNALVIALIVGAAICFGAFVLYGAWIDGRRQKVREQGKHPVTEADGAVTSSEALEDERHG